MAVAPPAMKRLRSRHSLVTPIDWKRPAFDAIVCARLNRRRHSLVTPIDWKLCIGEIAVEPNRHGRHSLVTPIDWKPSPAR